MASPTDPELDELRREVDRIDGAMVDLLAERLRVVRAIAGDQAASRRRRAGDPAGPRGRILRRLVERSGHRLPGRHAGAHVARAAGRHHPGAGAAGGRRLRARRTSPSCGTLPATISARRRRSSGPPAGRRRCGCWPRVRPTSPSCRCPTSASPGGRACSILRPAAAGRGPSAIRPCRRRSRWQWRLGGRRHRARAVGRRSHAPGRRGPAPRSAARGCSTFWPGPDLDARWLATPRPARRQPPYICIELDGFVAPRRSPACAAADAGRRASSCAACGWAAMPVPSPPATDAAAGAQETEDASMSRPGRGQASWRSCPMSAASPAPPADADCQTVVEREPAGPEPEGGRGLPRACGRAASLPGRQLHALRQAIARRHNLDPERDRLRRRLGRADRRCWSAPMPGPGDEVLYSRHGFLMYPLGRAGGRRRTRWQRPSAT